ncbi:muts domain V-domain-containing protein, partial [Ochromonadaceae sp. CCMP2298]
ISCSTEEFNSLSDRANEAITQALSLTHELIQALLADLRTNIDCLFTLTDSVAMLDMLSSFADLVALSPHPFTRPVMTPEGPIVIKAGRHPVVSTIATHQLASSFISNDLFLSPLENMHIVTGPNGSGKTVYIKQTALIVIMAQIGCFVPAKHATLPVRDRLLSRLGSSDDMEHNMSTFFTEMKEASYVLANLTDRSLVLIDELGRGTSTIDGLSIAFAIAEELLRSRALTLFVTHYPQITNLVRMYANVKNIHMKTTVDSASVASTGMRYLREVGNGPCDMTSCYGIIMAESMGFPADITAEARTLRSIVRDKFPVLTDQGQQSASRSASSVTNLLQQLQLLRASTLDDRATQVYLHNLRERIPAQAAE